MIEIVPTIELQGGQVVDTRIGSPESYPPIETPLARSSAPVEVIEGFLRTFPFRRMHLLDLDGKAGQPAQIYTTASLETRFPQIEFWVENGAADEPAVRSWIEHRRGMLVIDSASQSDARLLARFAPTARIVLSLDYQADAGVGAAEIFERPTLWPEQVVVVTPTRLGAGPDVAKLRAIRASAGHRAIYAATGVRETRDLVALEEAGIAGALVASGLHDGRIGAEDLAAIAEVAGADVC